LIDGEKNLIGGLIWRKTFLCI